MVQSFHDLNTILGDIYVMWNLDRVRILDKTTLFLWISEGDSFLFAASAHAVKHSKMALTKSDFLREIVVKKLHFYTLPK